MSKEVVQEQPPFDVAWKTIDGLKIRYATNGRGVEKVVLFSPWPESIFAFAPVWAGLTKQFEVLAFDLPGFGRSDAREDLFAPQKMERQRPPTMRRFRRPPGSLRVAPSGGNAVDPQDALFRGHAEAKRKSVVPRAAMNPHPVGTPSPEAVIRNPISEEPQEGPLQAEAQEPDLPTVRVSGQHEVPVPGGEMTERPRIVKQDDP